MSKYNHGGLLLLGSKIAANMNTTADQAIPLISANYVLTEILATNSSANLTLAAGGIYTAASKGGSAVVAATQVYTSLTNSTDTLRLTLAAAGQIRLTATPLYLSLTTGQGSAATLDLYIWGYALD